MRAVPPGTTPAAVATPLIYDLLGYQFELAPMILGVASCVIVRVYMGAKAKSREGWVADIAITLLTLLFTVGMIGTTRPNLLMALMLGTGLGAIGAGLIHLAEVKMRAALGGDVADTPSARAGDVVGSVYGGTVDARLPSEHTDALKRLDQQH